MMLHEVDVYIPVSENDPTQILVSFKASDKERWLNAKVGVVTSILAKFLMCKL